MNSKINQNDYQVLLREEKELEENVPIRVSIFQKGSTDRIFQKGTEFFTDRMSDEFFRKFEFF